MTLTSRAPDAARTAIARFATLGSLTLALAVAGCTSTPDPAPSPTVTEAVATPTPTPTPTSTASPKPERPAAMDDVTVEGAIAAATYFISLYPYVYNTGDLTEWNELSHPECIFCASVSQNVADLQQDGHHLSGGDVTIEESTGVEINAGAWFSVELLVDQASGVNVDADGNPVSERAPGVRYKITYSVIRESDRWIVREVEPHAADE